MDTINSNMDATRQIFIAVLVVLITLVFYLIYKRSRTTRRSVLLTGICNSGKTAIFTQLVHQKDVQSFTSMKDNVGDYICDKGHLKIVDIPGHERLRYKYIDEHKASAKGVVFVVDSSNIHVELKDAAEYLFNILCDDVLKKNKVKVLILCNKQDHTFAKEQTAIRSMFKQELSTLQDTKAQQVENLDSNSKNSSSGDKSKNFNFEHFRVNVEFLESIARHSKNGHNELDDLENWLCKLAQ